LSTHTLLKCEIQEDYQIIELKNIVIDGRYLPTNPLPGFYIKRILGTQISNVLELLIDQDFIKSYEKTAGLSIYLILTLADTGIRFGELLGFKF
jgi:hypothetical protein